MKTLLTLGMAAGLLISACAAYAYPSQIGPTGTGALPTAAVVPACQIDLAGDFINTDTNATFPVRAVYGATDNLEIGAGYSFLDDANSWLFNAKYATKADLAGFKVSVGATYDNFSDLDINDTQVYLVGDQKFKMGNDKDLTASVGVIWSQSNFNPGSIDVIRVFGGIQVPIAEKVSFVGDIQSSNSNFGDADPLYSIGLRCDAAKNLQAQVGFTNSAGVFAIPEGNLYAGLNFSFNTK